MSLFLFNNELINQADSRLVELQRDLETLRYHCRQLDSDIHAWLCRDQTIGLAFVAGVCSGGGTSSRGRKTVASGFEAGISRTLIQQLAGLL